MEDISTDVDNIKEVADAESCLEINMSPDENSEIELSHKQDCKLKGFAEVCKKKAGTAINFFNENINEFKNKYSSDKFLSSVGHYAKKLGASAVYSALLLFYALQNGKVPLKKRVLAIAALGYFIAPLDFIPDIILGGLVDDVAIIMYAVNTLSDCIDEETRTLARLRIRKWFGETEIAEMKIPANLL